MIIFLYGLFMDEELLARKNVETAPLGTGFVDGYRLCIGERATLVPQAGKRAYGMVMDIGRDNVDRLYSEPSVADYLPETVEVQLLDGAVMDATCYNLPPGTAAGTNREYASALLEVATRLGLPQSYLQEIEQAGSGSAEE